MRAGFTLIEMSIVLVIIGLIIGGILVGRDLIKSSEVTAQISQVTKYNSAVNAFANKYGGIPGDLNVLLANQFGFNTTSCTGSTFGLRDGNNLIDGCVNGAGYVGQTCGETALFWADLSSAKLIDNTFPNSGATALNCASQGIALSLTPGTAYLGNDFPQGKIGYGTFVYVYETNGANWYGLSTVSSIGPGFSLSSTPGLPVISAYNIDKKMDDGLPTTGSVRTTYVSNTIQNSLSAPTDTASTCYSGTSTFAYSLSATASQGAGLNCALSFKFQ